MINKIKKKGILFFIISLFVFFIKDISAQDELELDEAYIEIKSKGLKDDFFMVRYDYASDEVYIPIKALFYFLEIYSVKVDFDKKITEIEVDTEKKIFKLEGEKSLILDGDLYVELENLKKSFKFKDVNWIGYDLKLMFTTDFILPYEIREKSKVERLRLNDKNLEEEHALIVADRGFITPGLLRVDYSKYDLQDNSYRLNLEYGTQLFYGDFYINQNLVPENEVKSYNLTYYDVYKDKDLIFGDFYMKIPDFIKGSSMVEGVSFGEKNTYSSTTGNTTTIKGEAQGADIIELYQNGILLDYQRPQGKDFLFEVKDRNYGGEYSLKIYYNNGQIETRKVYTVGDSKLLNVGEWDYSAQIGQDKMQNKIQGLAEVRYGLTKNISFGTGILQLEGLDEKYNILKNEIIFRQNWSQYPLVINFQNFYEYDKVENSFEIRANQKIKTYDLNLKYFDYSDYLGQSGGIKTFYSIGLYKTFNNTRVGLGYQEEVKMLTLSKERGYYISLEDRSLRNFSLILDAEVTKNNNKNIKYEINPGISYGGLDNLTMVLQANIKKEKKIDTEYIFKLLGRRKRIQSLHLEYMLGIETRYNSEEKTRFGMNFTMYFDNYMYLEMPISRNENNELQVGISVEKTFDLSDIKRNIKDRQVDGSWIYGKVYIDANDNGKYDEGETVVPDVALIVNGRRTISDENGEYRMSELQPLETYKVEVDRKSIDPMLNQVIDKKRIQTRASIGTRYDVGVQAVSMVTGNIIPHDNMTSDELIRILSMTTIILEKNGQSYMEIDPEFDGMYFFENVLPGEYEIKFNYLGSENIQFSEENLMLLVELNKEDEGEYFEGYDIFVEKLDKKDDIESKVEVVNTEEIDEYEDTGFDLDDILNNF